ncbi:MAG: CRP/FNR family transcriptional regulator [Oceanicoccus sp.]|jgi:CRP/FNR family transcriptional regulator
MLEKNLPPFADNLLYGGLSSDEMESLNQLGKTRQVAANEYLFHQHSESSSLYTINQGFLMVERTSLTGLRQIMAFVYPGNFVGFTHNDSFEYSVKALTPAQIVEFPRQKFLALCDDSRQLKRNIDTITSRVMLLLFDQIFAIGQKKAHERLCFLLQQLKERQTIAGGFSFELFMTRQDMADYLGLTLETVSRAFTRLQKENIIKVLSAHYVEVLDTERLEVMAYAH